MGPARRIIEDYNQFAKDMAALRPLPDLISNSEFAFEPVSFIVAVNDRAEFDLHIGNSANFRNGVHQWLCIDGAANASDSCMGQIYNDAMAQAHHDICFFVHQDVFFPPDWEVRMARAVKTIEGGDPDWGVVGCAGCVTTRTLLGRRLKRRMRGHWSDPHGLFRPARHLPARVEILDEMILGMRRSSGLTFDASLPGFHHYATDLCLAARAAGKASYAVDAPVVHKLFNSDGELIHEPADSPKLQCREQVKNSPEYLSGAAFISHKWASHLPFYSTSHLFVSATKAVQ